LIQSKLKQMKHPLEIRFKLIALALVCALPIALAVPIAARAEELCQARLDASGETDNEINNCPIATGDFSIRGTFANSNWQASLWAWEPGYYILHVKNQLDDKTINLTGFNVLGTTRRPQYRFTDRDRGLTYIVTFQYTDSNIIRLEIYEGDRLIVNELLPHESDRRIGGP
jgi:hypothetical protein